MRVLLVLPVLGLLGGCALPVPLQVAGWVLDGVSLVTTEKSLSDHGLSAVAGKDCALWRGVTENEICRDYQAPVQIAEVFFEPDLIVR